MASVVLAIPKRCSSGWMLMEMEQMLKEEYTKFQEAVQEKLKDKGKGGAGKGAGLGDRLFTMMDADKDGSITLDEFKKARKNGRTRRQS